MVYWTSNDNKNKENTMKKIYEYITITMSVIGLMAMIGATGAIEKRSMVIRRFYGLTWYIKFYSCFILTRKV